ncbi:hypothetical protein M434DRAFT_31633 [Hypoxylon sp. CO27-5]|nr:hypothetical protein M434DRAFT_31633 [Hypoxylon sp. CO27-5]
MAFQNGASPSANGNPFLQVNRGNPFPSGEETRAGPKPDTVAQNRNTDNNAIGIVITNVIAIGAIMNEEFYEEEEEDEDVVVDDQVREKEEQVKESFEQRHYHHHSHHIHLPEGINPLQVAVAMNGGEINVNMIDIDDFTLLANRHNALRSEIRAFLITIAREHPDNHRVIQRWVNNLIEHYPNCELAKALASDADNSST